MNTCIPKRKIELEKNERIVCPAIWINDGKEYKNQPLNISIGFVQFGIHLVDVLYRMNKRKPGYPIDIQNLSLNEVCEGYYTNMERFIPRWIEY